jgi:hypothetical protein
MTGFVLYPQNVILGVTFCYGINELIRRRPWQKEALRITSATHHELTWLYTPEHIHFLYREDFVADLRPCEYTERKTCTQNKDCIEKAAVLFEIMNK